MKIVVLLPIKANSERVSGKNFKNFCGKPLFQWILGTLESVKEIDEIVINTDASEILIDNGLVINNRIILRDRRQDLCGDYVSMNDVLSDDVNNVDADIYLMTHTTNPLLSKESIREALSIFKNALRRNSADSLFSVNKVQDRFYDRNSMPLNHDPNNLIRTQDLEPWYVENSNLYLFTKESFLKNKARIGINPIMYETPPRESTDIDTIQDWDLAEALVSYYESLESE
jgi:CMP-N-acetylneuraminic acid synthetase